MVNETLAVYYHDIEVAVISYDAEKNIGYFEYTPEFVATNQPLSPLKMPLKTKKVYQFPQLNPVTFKGLPGLVADSLPDRFGTSVLNQWVAQQGRTQPISVIERLQYTGTRGMGALEFRPSRQLKKLNASQAVNLEKLTELAQSVLNKRKNLQMSITKDKVDIDAMKSLLAVGTSAGGARPKAVLAFNQDFSQVRSGQVNAPQGFEHYLMKFDGVSEHNQSEEAFGDPLGYGTMEYVYYLMAKACGIDMQDCHLLDEGSRRHFLTKRFDRLGNDKIHIQTLSAIAHVDYNTPGSFSYEELFAVARQLRLPLHDAKQLFLRMAFNHIARNNNDHAKNFSFVYHQNKWRLSPAYDMAYCYKPNNLWVEQHWMSANGKRINHHREDLIAVGENMTKLPHSLMHEMIDKVLDSVSQWNSLAKTHGVPKPLRLEIDKNLPIRDYK